MIEKTAKNSISLDKAPIQALNKPIGWEIFDGEQELSISRIKLASLDKTQEENYLGGFDLTAAIEKHPDFLFCKVFAIKKDEVNDNGDAFSEEELVKATHTFIGVPLFCNHANDDIEKARGKVVHAWYDYKKGGIYIISMVDKIAYPKLARGIEEGYVNGSSMGTQVQGSCCSICHHYATTADKYCFVEKTPILMSDYTIKNISDVIVGDTVVDAYGKFTKVTQLFKRRINEKVCVIKSRAINGELVVTKNHPFLVNCRGEYRYHPCEYLNDKETLFTPVYSPSDDVFFSKFGFNHLTEEKKISLIRMLGFYAAEGCIIRRDGIAKGVEFSFHKDEVDYVSEITESSVAIFGKEPYNYVNKGRDNCRKIRIWNNNAADFFDKACHGTVRNRTKSFDSSVFGLSPKFKKELLATFIDGDGHCNTQHQINIVSACPILASQIYYLCLHCEMSPSFNSYDCSGGPWSRDKTTVIQRISLGRSQLNDFYANSSKVAKAQTMQLTQSKLDNVFTEDGLFSKHRIYTIDEVQYDGDVYNIETESNSYVANNTSVHNCSHIKEKKTRKLSGEVKCQYHKSKEKHKGYEDKCPVCGCTADNVSVTMHKDAVVYEHNYGLKFIEDSFVVNPACHDCLVECILNVPEFTRKVAYINSQVDMNKVAVSDNDALVKIAGKQEIDSLNKAMKHMEVVAKSMMDQKQKVSMEYVSDIVDVLASLQTVTDELVEMGYAAIPSPPNFQNPESLPDASPITGGTGVQATPGQMPPPAQASAPAPTAPQSLQFSNAPLSGGIGSVTKPTTASEKIKELHKQGSNIKSKISSLSEILNKYKDSKVDYQLTKNNITVTASKNSKGGLVVSVFVDGNHLRTEEELSPGKLTESFSKNPDESALTLIAQVEKEITIKESENNMSNTNVKTAAGSALTNDSTQVTTEKQLNEQGKKLEFAGQRQEKEINGITESDAQLGQSKEPVNDTSSDSPQVRTGTYAEETIDGQIGAMAKGPIARWNSFPEVITEKQWTDFTRLVGAELSEDQAVHTTEAQIKDLLKNHRWVEPNFTTENQLSSDKNWLATDNAWLNKEAAASYAKKLVEASIDALSDTIANFQHTPQEVINSVKFITKDPQSQIKAAYMLLINGMPTKVAGRKSEVARMAYFGKFASSASPIDSTLACMGDHCMNLKAEDFIDAVRYVASDPSKMAKVEEVAKAKIAKANSPEIDTAVDKFAAFESAFASMNEKTAGNIVEDNQVNDGLYRVQTAIEEIGDINNVDAFIASAESHARTIVKEADTVLYSVDVDTDNGTVVTILKSASKLTDDEKDAATKLASRSENRASLVKEAQMMGGQLGGGMGGGGDMGGGGGATMPAPGGAPGAPGAPAPAPVEQMDAAGAEPMEEEKGGEPMPPGSICPLCGTEDVDVVAGQANCKNPECGAKFKIKVNLEIIEGPGIAGGNATEGEGEEEGLGSGEAGLEAPAGEAPAGGEGFPMPSGEAPNIPVAAMTRVNPDLITKLSSKEGWQLGGFSPLTGSTNVFKTAKNNWLCLDTGVEYEVDTRINEKQPKEMWIEWRWTPKFASHSCPTCNRTKLAWSKALANNGMTDEQFDELSFKKKAETVLAMEKAGAFGIVKTASKNVSVTAEIQKQFKLAGAFPTDLCKQKLANRYGPEALAISGPCKGEKLADCVCEQLKKASVYSDGFATKLASTWSEKDPCLECMEDYIRVGLDMEKAASVCQHLKVKYASPEELLGEEMNNDADGMNDSVDTGIEEGGEMDDFGDEDPFTSELEVGEEPGMDEGVEIEIGGPEGDIAGTPETTDISTPEGGLEVKVEPGAKPGEGSVTIELPLSAVDAIEQAIDIVHGKDPAAEEHHDIPAAMENQEVPLDIPAEAINPLEEAASQTIEDATGIEGEENEGAEGMENTPEGEVSLEAEPSVEIEIDATENPEAVEGALPEGDNAEIDGGAGEESVELEEDAEKPEAFEGEEENKEKEDDAFKLSSYMHRGYNGRVGQINLDVSGILAAINKKAGTVEIQRAQDSVGKIQGDAAIGNEEKFKADKPNVPRGQATMGKEPKDLNPKDKPLPEVPTGDGSMGHEKELGYTAEGAKATGGDKGQGKTETAKANKTTKTASEKKIEQQPVSENVKGKKVDFSANKDHKNTPDNLKRTPFEEKENVKIPEKGEGSFIGDEKKSIGSLPEEPSIPTGGGKNPKFDKNEKNTPEDTNKVKGTVIASDDKSKIVKAEAVRIAGRMIEAKIIEASNLMNKIAELEQYQLSQLQDIEKALFKSAAKGLTTVSDGLEQAVPTMSGSDQPSLKDQISSMFTLNHRNDIASENTDADLRKTHGR